jgi:hypothetical protein
VTGTDTELERRLRDLSRTDNSRLAGRAAMAVNTERAWRDLRDRRQGSAVRRRRGLVAATVVAVVAVVIAAPILSRSIASSRKPTSTGSGHAAPAAPKTYAGAITARIPLSGVVAMAGSGSHAYVIRRVGPPELAGTYQLVSIDLSTNTVSFQVGLGRQEPAMAAGGGKLWLTTANQGPRAQIVEMNPETGRVTGRIHVQAGACAGLAFGSGRLFAVCGNSGATRAELWSIDPRSGRARLVSAAMHGYANSIVATPHALWYSTNYIVIRGFANPAGQPRPLSADWGGYQVSPGGQGLVYASGSIWALAAGEQLARIDPSDGRVQRVYTYRDYDPSRLGGLDFLTAGGGWLWFLDNGYPFSGVLRVSMATGHPAGGVPVPPNSCGQQTCSQVYYVAGSVWVPTAELLLRIDPAKLPG